MPGAFHPPPFRCAVSETGGTVHVQPAGELDLSTVPLLEARLRAALDGGGRRLVVDLRELTFMDSTGLTLLSRWTFGARLDGYDFALIAGNERIQQLFAMTGLTPHFTFVEG